MVQSDMYEKLITFLDKGKASYRLIDHVPEGRTEIVSPMRGNKLAQAAKCIVLMLKLNKKTTKYVLGVVPGDAKINLNGIKSLFDASYISFASTDIAESLAGSVSGTVLPFSFNPELELIVDPLLLENKEIFFNAARLDRSMALKTEDYVRMAQARLENIAEYGSNSGVVSKKDTVIGSPEQDKLSALRHSCAHLLAAAILELYPNAKRTIGPAIENGFYYDFDFGAEKISESNLEKIENKMRAIAPTWEKFDRQEVDATAAKEVFKDNEYKQELIDEFSQEGQTLTLYKSGNYVDLCRGGHSENPGKELKHFKLLSVAGAYWRGSEKNKMLTRIYGTCFPTKAELDAHLLQLEEAKKRDHRKIGAEQELFFFDDSVGKGLVLWLPNGTIIRNEVEKLAWESEAAGNYLRVRTPHLAKEELFLTSGHLPYYKDSMYPAMVMDDGTYYLKAMNCPHHHTIFNFKPHSYRELPLRLAEYGECYRNELSGTLAGLLRVRAMAMNDAHIYCTKDQIKNEFKNVMAMVMEYFRIFKLENYWFRLSKWSPEHLEKYVNEPDNWNYSEGIIREVLQEMKVKFVEADDEAAFYGPKVDVMFKSAVGREETMSTIQLDFVAKKRFGLKYTDSDGKENNEVFVIHRAPLSTQERFMAFLIEHFAGVWPVWLSPVQILFAPVGEKHVDGANNLADEFKNAGVRVEVDSADETLGNKVRKAATRKIPYIVVVGDKELEGGDLMIRVRGEEKPVKLPKAEFLAKVLGEIKERV